MSRLPFIRIHAAILLLVLIPAKLAKGLRLATDAGWGAQLSLLLPDIAFVVAIELAVLGILGLLGARLRPWARAAWGLCLIPMVAFGVTEHRFFVSSGSFLDFGLLAHGLRHLDEISGLVGAELNPVWTLLLLSSIPIGLLMTRLGWRGEHRGPTGLGAAALGLGAALFVVVLIGWGGPRPSDPRLASLKGSFFANLAYGAVNDIEGGEEEVAGLNLDRPLPDKMELEAGPGAKKKNVVFIVLESVRAESTSAYNPELDTSPFLDHLAKTGLKVEHAYTTLPHTTKSLVPVLCGVPPDIRQPLTETVPGAIPVTCLPEMLGALGYRTAFFQPATQSFEQRATTVANAGFQHFVAREQLKTEGFESPNYLGVEERALDKPILDWIGESDEPFFLTVLTLITHHDYKVPTSFDYERYDGVSERLSNYYNTIRYTDAWLKQLWDELDEKGLLDDTLFVLMGDHGEGHGEHGRKGHDEILYEQGIRVPLIFWGPGVIDEPRVIDGLRQNIDLVPTVVDLLDLTVKEGSFFGKSVLEPADDRVIYASCWYEDRCVGRLQWPDKFVYYFDRHPIELFDLSADPGEEHNKADTLKPAQIEAWEAEMLAWRQDIRSLYATHQKERNTGFILFERPDVDQPLEANFSGEIAPIGFDVKGDLAQGQDVTVEVYYEVLDNMGWHWKLHIELEDAKGKIHKLRFSSSEAGHPLYTWVPGQYRKVEYTFKMPGGYASGDGALRISVKGYRGKKLAVTGKDADPKANDVRLKVKLKG